MSEIYHCPEDIGGEVHDWDSESWGIYCKRCGEIRVLPDMDGGEPERGQTHYMDGTPIHQ